MKRLFTITFIAAIAFVACKKDSVSPEFDKSLEVWNDFKASAHNSYTYVAHGGSWTGYYAETKITVTNGKVTGRDFKSGYYKPGTDSLTIQTTWSESGATLNTHQSAHESLTIDQIYTKARTEWLAADKQTNDVYFEANNNGILSSAGYIPKNCADDCFNGINIKDIKVYVKEIK